MKKLISLTVAAMMVLPAMAMAMGVDDPCPEENKTPIYTPKQGSSKEIFHKPRTTAKKAVKKTTAKKSTKKPAKKVKKK